MFSGTQPPHTYFFSWTEFLKIAAPDSNSRKTSKVPEVGTSQSQN